MKQKIKCIQKITLIYILMTITKEMYDKFFCGKEILITHLIKILSAPGATYASVLLFRASTLFVYCMDMC